MAKMIISKKKKQAFVHFFIHIFLIALSVVLIFPLYWMIRGAFMESALDVMDVSMMLPNKFDFGNFTEAFSAAPFGMYLGNTVKLIVNNVVAVVLSSSFVAFGFSRIKFRYRDTFFVLVLMVMMIPGTVLQIPQFVSWVTLGAYDTLIPLTLPAWFSGVGNVFLLRQFFMTLPREYDEAAIIDGASWFRIYWQITLPLSKPALTTIGVFTFMGAWNDFFGPLLYLPSEENWSNENFGIQ